MTSIHRKLFAPDPREGFNIGWSYASHNVYLPEDAELDLRQGYEAGKKHFAGRRVPPPADRFVRKWLQLQANAWRRGRAFDQEVTPDYIRRITPVYCPITRESLTMATGTDTDWSVDRLVNRACYAPGNLVVMSARANIAKDNLDYAQILNIVDSGRSAGGLSPLEWARMATMVGMTEDQHSLLPLLVVPPTKLLISNRFTLLQMAMMYAVTGRFTPCLEQDMRRACHGKLSKRKFTELLDTIAGQLKRTKRTHKAAGNDPYWWFEDAWCDGRLVKYFKTWVDTLSAGDIDECILVARRQIDAMKRIKGNARAGWCEESNGYVVPETPSAAAMFL